MKQKLCNTQTKTLKHRIRGVTIIELLMALTIGALLIGVGMPAYESLVRTNRLATDTNRLVASIHYARSEAIKRGANVRICIPRDATIANALCTNSGATDWSAGWNIGVVGGAVLRREAALTGAITLIEEGPNTQTGRMDFDRIGFTADGRTIVACEPTAVDGLARGLIVSPVGQIRTASDGNGDGIVENAAGDNVDCS